MHTLLTDSLQRREMANAARAHATSTFNVDRMAQGYAKVYQDALAASGTRVPLLQVSGSLNGKES
jgi:glycosyltransferase involved in cell wall biosynthesis